MKLQFFVPRWGSEHISWDDFLLNSKKAGYNGVEWGIACGTNPADLDVVWEKLDKHNLSIIPQYYGTNAAEFNVQSDRYSAWLELLKPYPAVKIDSQTGRDFFTFDQNKQLIEIATKHTQECAVKVCHETHRNKALFTAHISKGFLENISGMEITFDVSHWVNVAESYLEDQPEAIDIAIAKTGHIHARVGYPEGPQVPDPRIPEWNEALKHHLKWWDKIAERFKNKDEILTITPEFGPYPYMVHLPGSNAPIADQWAVNKFMKDLLNERYKEF